MNVRISRWISLFLLLSLLMLSCRLLSPRLETSQPGDIVYREDFSNPNSGWNRATAPSGVSDYADGVYRILVNDTNTDIWAMPGLNFGDVSVEVDVFKVGGDRNNRFGLICRAVDEANFYTFIISSDGYYGIGKIRGLEYSLIGMDAMQPSEVIAQGSSFNHIRADCVGPNLKFYVNGQLIAQAQDNEFLTGDVGLIAGTYDIPGTDIRFDNFIVRNP